MQMSRIVKKNVLAPNVNFITVQAPDIAKSAHPGQFVVIRVDDMGERIPLTLMDWDKNEGTISIIFQEVGVSTRKLGMLEVSDCIHDVFGPLGVPSDVKHHSTVAVVCGGVGTAAAHPIARGFKETGNRVISIIGARTKDLLILEDELSKVSDEVYISTNDGSKGFKGFVSDLLKELIVKDIGLDFVYVVGPPLMMKSVAEVTRPYGIKTIVSLNPIMVDGMGLCGACRVTVGGEKKFACVDGPDFDGHQVDFDELLQRLRMFSFEEKVALEHRIQVEKCGNCQ